MQYKLLKDQVSIKAGIIFTKTRFGYYVANWIDSKGRCDHLEYFPDEVENNPEWFAPIDERWKPQSLTNYWTLLTANHSIVYKAVWMNDPVDRARYSHGVVFRTYEEAEHAAAKVKELLLSLHKK